MVPGIAQESVPDHKECLCISPKPLMLLPFSNIQAVA
jgi:hypothetical protein